MAVTSGDLTRSKGFTVRGALAFVDARYGPEGRAKLLTCLDPETRGFAERIVLASEWLPFRVQVHMYEGIDKAFGKGDYALCWQVGRFTSEHEMSTINQIFLKLGKLEHWFRAAGLMWNRYYSAGRLEVGDFSKKSGLLRVSDFDPISRAFCLDLAGWFERTAELSGEKDVKLVHSECVLVGGRDCVYQASWS